MSRYNVLVGHPNHNIGDEDANVAHSHRFDGVISIEIHVLPLERIDVYAQSNNSSINDSVAYNCSWSFSRRRYT